MKNLLFKKLNIFTGSKHPKFLIVGSKCDLEDQRTVETIEGVEVSSKNDVNVTQAFEDIITLTKFRKLSYFNPKSINFYKCHNLYNIQFLLKI